MLACLRLVGKQPSELGERLGRRGIGHAPQVFHQQVVQQGPKLRPGHGEYHRCDLQPSAVRKPWCTLVFGAAARRLWRGGSFLEPFEPLVVVGAHLLQLLLELPILRLEPLELRGKVCQRALKCADSSIEVSSIITALCSRRAGPKNTSRHDKAAQSKVPVTRESMERHRGRSSSA